MISKIFKDGLVSFILQLDYHKLDLPVASPIEKN